MEKQAHIQLSRADAAPFAILVGDPARVDRVGKFLDSATYLSFNREFKSLKGSYQGVPILVVSTGIGGVSTAIAVEELAAIGVKVMIRVGSCGAMQRGIDLGELIISLASVRDDGTSKQYTPIAMPAVADSDIVEIMRKISQKNDYTIHVGITRSHDSFYVDDNEEVESFWSNLGILGGDMETSTLFVVGRHRGVKVASVLNNVVKYQESLDDGVNSFVAGSGDIMRGESNSIILALETIKKMTKDETNEK